MRTSLLIQVSGHRKQENTHVTQYGLSLDEMGRWAVAVDAFWNFAGTPGPYIAPLIVTYGGFGSLEVWVFTSGAIRMALFCYAAKRSDALGLEELAAWTLKL